jgi:protein tyrosine/serine phosphatase
MTDHRRPTTGKSDGKTDMAAPLRGSYWALPGRLLAGRCPIRHNPDDTVRDLTMLIASGIRHVIDLMDGREVDRNGKPFPDYMDELEAAARAAGVLITRRKIPVDHLVPSDDAIRLVLDEIDRALADGKPVYLHCWAGRGRTGVIVGCYLVRSGLSGEEALNEIARLRRHEKNEYPSPEAEMQRNIIRTWRDRNPNSL